MIYYTSATSCFIPKARVLGKSLKKYNPAAKFYLVLSDKLPDGFDLAQEPFDGVLFSDEIVLDSDMSVPFWFYLHDVTELCTAVKGWAALELLERTGEDKIVYLDPDIAVFRSLEPLEKMLDEHDIIVTPHRLAPEPRFDDLFYGDHQFYTRGGFNLGFVAVKKTEQGIAFLKWWHKMLESLCYIDDPQGLFTDQKLIDLAPCFFDKLYICRDEGYNVSWWNITQRTISGTAEDLRVNGNPVYFYHFSNYDSGLHKRVITDHCNNNKDLWKLFDWYTDQQNANGYEQLRKHPCVYNTYDNGEPITSTARVQSRKRSDIMNNYRHCDPYKTSGDGTLYGYYKMYFPEYMDGWTTSTENAAPGSGTYYEMYQAIIRSRSYRLSKKLMSAATRILPPGSGRRTFLGKCWRFTRRVLGKIKRLLTGQTAKKRKTVIKNFEKTAIVSSEHPDFSVLLRDAADINNVYTAIRSVCLAQQPANGIEVLVAGKLSQKDWNRLTDTFSGLKVFPNADLAQLAKMATGTYLLLFGENLTMPADYFCESIARMEQTGAAVIQSRVCHHDSTIYEAGGVMTQSGQRVSYGFGFHKNWGSVRYYKQIDCPSLFGTLIEKAALEQVDGFDTDYCPLYQLADLSFKLRAAGRTTMYIPDISLEDGRDVQENEAPNGTREDAQRFVRKWADTLERENVKSASDVFLGRDRACGRKTIFSVDDRIPCYDKSAGDRTTYHYYIVMAEMGYNLKIVADEMRRREPYATELEKLGIEIVSADGSGDAEWQDFLRRNGKYIDVVYLNRPYILEKYYGPTKEYTSAKLVYNCMDLHFLRESREMQIKNDLEGLKQMEAREQAELEKIDLADVIFSVSTYENKILESKLKHAEVVLNPIFVYHDFPEVKHNFDERKDVVFVGGFGHTPNVDAVKWMCSEILPDILKKHPDLRLHIVGSNPTEEIKKLSSKNVICHGFMEEEELIELYHSCRMSVVPLRYGAGVKGKVLEAMYHGLPVVSTSIGTEGIEDIETCIENTDDAKAFADKVIELYDDMEKLTEMSKRNQQYVKDHLGVEPARRMFEHAFE